MTENSSVTALMGSTIPNQKDPPRGESISPQEKPIRNLTQTIGCFASKIQSQFHLPSTFFVTAITSRNMSLP